MKLGVMYRGPLASCNYGCTYCPFAKREETAAQLSGDQQALRRFTEWLAGQRQHEWRILFTPWGEALVRSWYREAIASLTHLPHIALVAVQTNLSRSVGWVSECHPGRLALWATYHPTQTERGPFLSRIMQLKELGVSVSVGMVGLTDAIEEIEAVRRELPSEIYLWVNAQQPRPRPYTEQELERLQAIDPRFDRTLKRHPSLGKECVSGQVAFTVDGRGDMRRCHLVAEVIGNVYDPSWEQSLQPRLCPNRTCSCYLGKAQLSAESEESIFGERVRIQLPLA